MKKTQPSSAHKWMQKGRGIWIKANNMYPNPQDDAFLEANIISVGQNDVVIQFLNSQQQFNVSMQNCQKLTYGTQDAADMVDLEELNQPQLLHNIKRRYFNGLIFTYCGPTLLIINPYEPIDKLFNDGVMNQYQTLVFTQNLQYKYLSPHIFGLSAFCIWQLFDNDRDQSIVISGQSGAGKTENTKYCLKFLASLGKNVKDLMNDKKKINPQLMRSMEKAIKKTSNKLNGIQDRILGCNEILEAFGNSKTIRNDNSSRFGKLILLLYGETQIDIKSALITSYLLQKSRIVSISDGQRNYHVFYYFCKGATIAERKKYLLKDPIDKYYYLNQSTVYDIKSQSDQQKFKALKTQFQQYLSEQQIDCVLKIISIVLNAGNIRFKKTETKDNLETAQITNQQYLHNVSELLEVEHEKLKHSLLFKTRKLGMNLIDSPLKYDEVLALRDSLSKNIYQKVFNFLVEKLNEKIEIQKVDLDSEQKRDKKSFRKSIGILDIFGFQVLGINTLEQFFINFANQKLQQLYVSYIFKEQQNQFLKQGLSQFSQDIGFQDNKPIIDLFQLYPLGIFHLINQSSELNKPDDELPTSISRNHSKNQFVHIPLSKKGLFQINHSCSPVSYNTMSFTAKNKDQFSKQILEVIKNSKNDVLKNIIVGKPELANSSSAKKFLGSKFLNQMNKLSQQLYSCDCHFVRCIKPNSKKQPKLFTSGAVLQSLRYLGVLDSIIIRKLGYIYRRPFRQFHKKFYEIDRYIFDYPLKIKGMTEQNFKQESIAMLEKYMKKQIQSKNILFGVQKVMIKQSTLNSIEMILKDKKKLRAVAADRFKKMYWNAMFRSKVKILISRIKLFKAYSLGLTQIIRESLKTKKIIRLQKTIKKFLWKKRFQRIKELGTKSVTKIASYFKMRRLRKQFLKIKLLTVKVQKCCRAFITAGRLLRIKNCQSIINSYVDKAWMIILNKNATYIKKIWKGYRIRRQFKNLIQKIRKNTILKKIKARFVKVLFKHRYFLFRSALQKYKKPIKMLQSVVRQRYCSKVYKKLRKSVIIIQKAYRKYLTRKNYLSRLWSKYKSHLVIGEENKQRQLVKMNCRKIETKVQFLSETISIPYQLYPNQLLTRYLKHKKQSISNYKINESISFSDKNTIQAYIGDFDIISDIYYRGNWLSRFLETKQEIIQKNQYIVNISICDGFTTLVTSKDRIYCFQGSTIFNSDNPWIRIDLTGIPHNIDTNQCSGYLLMNNSKFYIWGDNKNNELLNEKKQVFHYLSENKCLKSIRHLSTKGENIYVIDNEQKLYERQLRTNGNRTQFMSPIKFFDKVNILSIAASYNFVHFLTSEGQLYSKGANYYGQLGLGFASQRFVKTPELNIYFKNKKQLLETISVGIGHTVGKSKLGYVYAWGDNKFGQINSQKKPFFHTPFQFQFERQKMKVYQAVAGSRATYFLNQNLKILANGTSSTFPSIQNVQFLVIQLLNETSSVGKYLVPLKISTTWSQTMSLLIINGLDMTRCKQNAKADAILKYCKIIAKQWLKKQIYPEYHEWMDNILNLSEMRRFKFNENGTIKVTKKVKEEVNNLQNIKIAMQLRKNSSFFKEQAKKKVYHYLKTLQQKQQRFWSEEDKQLSNYLKQHCMHILK